jgi:hypothetical protein
MALSQREKDLRIQKKTFAKFGLTTVQDVTHAYQQSLENDDAASSDGSTVEVGKSSNIALIQTLFRICGSIIMRCFMIKKVRCQ